VIYPETVNAARSRAIPGLLILLILVLALAACGGSASGEAGENFSDPSFARPTTIAKSGDVSW